jgi:uncharacterized membrane protein YvbJ
MKNIILKILETYNYGVVDNQSSGSGQSSNQTNTTAKITLSDTGKTAIIVITIIIAILGIIGIIILFTKIKDRQEERDSANISGIKENIEIKENTSIEEKQDNNSKKFCKYCGNKISTDATYCEFCGKKVN